MAFWQHDHQVQWSGIHEPVHNAKLHACDGRELLEDLIQEFDDVFAKPMGLPPIGTCDHRIHLLPGTMPVAVRPYRYPIIQKDEIERQCKLMEDQGLIRCSMAVFY